MPTEKTARQYTKLVNDLKTLQLRNRELEAEATRTPERIQDAIDAALTSARADHAETLRQRDALHEETLRQLAGLREELTTALTALSTTTAERDEAQRNLLAETVRADGLSVQVAAIQPQLDLIEQQRRELSGILDTVRERMRRKEHQEEQAILNRRVLGNATPGKNWG